MSFRVESDGLRSGLVIVYRGADWIAFSWDYSDTTLCVSFPKKEQWVQFCTVGKFLHASELFGDAKMPADFSWALDLYDEIKKAVAQNPSFRFKNTEVTAGDIYFSG